MHIVALNVKNFRIIGDLNIEPATGVNWIVGGNGAGKTSLLESIFLLARGRSFRSARHGAMVKEGTKQLCVKAHVLGEGKRGTLEISAGSGKKRLLDNGSRVLRIRDLFEKLHVRLIAENSQTLLENGPAVRRLFLDWNLFHVEPRYFDILSSFRRILSQRNAWLRKGAIGPCVWDEEFVELAEQVTRMRQEFAEALSEELATLNNICSGLPVIRTHLEKGWPANAALADALKASLKGDIYRGYTKVGPSRADLSISANGFARTGSRGEMKLVVCILQYAAEQLCSQDMKESCIWLFDDLSAELDKGSVRSLMEVYRETRQQIFATGRRMDKAILDFFGSETTGVFHVERGVTTA